jgi:L-lactate dehydrogenase
VKHIVDVLLHDQRAVLTICCRGTDIAGYEDLTFALPRLLGGDGVLATIPPALDPDQRQALVRSAETIRGAIQSMGVV